MIVNRGECWKNYYTSNKYKISKNYKRLSKNWLNKYLKDWTDWKLYKNITKMKKKESGNYIGFICCCGIYKSFLMSWSWLGKWTVMSIL
jgi:predicted transcriptional regulator YheO